jgi:hypothetical protein
VIVWGLLFCIHVFIYATNARVFSFTLPWWPFVLGVLAATYVLASALVRTVGGIVADRFYYAAATWLGAVFLTFSLFVVYEVFYVVSGVDSPAVLGAALGLSVVLSSYALFRGARLTTRAYTIPIVQLDHPIRVIHLSDIHVGTVHRTSYLEQIVRETNALKPDLVLITGDLFDGSAPIDEEMLRPLNALTAPAFFSSGNHEEYEGLDKVRTTLAHLDLQFLDNRAVVVNGVQVIGVNDRQSLPRGQTLNSVLEAILAVPNTPRILLYHTPVEWKDARAHGIDLMLSGHTHNGQIFPFTLLVRLFFRHINGLYVEGGRYLHVSPGTGTWGPPMRLGSNNQITVLELVPSV